MLRIHFLRATLVLIFVASVASAQTPKLTDQQRKFYETTLQVTKQEIADLKSQIAALQATTADRRAELQNAIDASMQMYAAACARLGIPNDLAGGGTATAPSGPPVKLTDQQKKFYETTLQVTKQEIADLKSQIAALEAKTADRRTELQNAIDACMQMYAAACNRLGIPNDLAKN